MGGYLFNVTVSRAKEGTHISLVPLLAILWTMHYYFCLLECLVLQSMGGVLRG